LWGTQGLEAAQETTRAVETCPRTAHVAITDRAFDGVAVAAAREPTHALPIAVDGLAAEQHDVGIGGEPGEQARKSLRGLNFEGGASLKGGARFQLHRPAETRHHKRAGPPPLRPP